MLELPELLVLVAFLALGTLVERVSPRERHRKAKNATMIAMAETDTMKSLGDAAVAPGVDQHGGGGAAGAFVRGRPPPGRVRRDGGGG